MNKQLIVVEIEKHGTMKIYENEKLIKKIDRVEIGKNGVSDKTYEGSVTTPLGKFNLGIAFGTHDLSVNYPYIKTTENTG